MIAQPTMTHSPSKRSATDKLPFLISSTVSMPLKTKVSITRSKTNPTMPFARPTEKELNSMSHWNVTTTNTTARITAMSKNLN